MTDLLFVLALVVPPVVLVVSFAALAVPVRPARQARSNLRTRHAH